MTKEKGNVLTRLQSMTRKARTILSRQLLAQGLYAGQDKIILALAHKDGQSPSSLAQTLSVQPPTITKMINRLAAQGFLEKRPSGLDGRRTHIFLTPMGEEAINAIQHTVQKTEVQALAGIDKKDLKTLKRLLDQIDHNISDQPQASKADEKIADDKPE